MERRPAFLFLLMLLFYLIPATPAMAIDNNEAVFQQLLDGERLLKQRSFKEIEKPTIYLTFDDGPSKLTPQVLDILKAEDVKATFFVLGQLAESRKELLKRINDEGHAIGNHTYSHNYSKLYTSFSTYWNEIQKTENILDEIVGKRPSIVRTPGGTYKNWDPFYFFYMDQADYIVYDWNIDSGDSKRVGVPSNEIIQNVKKSKLNNKLILLMHDGTGHENTVKALPEIIHYYKEKGYQFSRLTEEIEPVIHPRTTTRWERENEFDKRSLFVREKVEKTIVVNKGKQNKDLQKIKEDLMLGDHKQNNIQKEELEEKKPIEQWLASADQKWMKAQPSFTHHQEISWFSIIKNQVSMLLYKIFQPNFTFHMLFIYN